MQITVLPFCERDLVATTTKNDCTQRARAKQLQCGSRPYSCEPVASLTRPVSGLLKLVRSMHTITIANETHLIESTRILVDPLHQRILCIHSCRSPALQNRLPVYSNLFIECGNRTHPCCSTAATQHNYCNPKICLSNAGIGITPAV